MLICGSRNGLKRNLRHGVIQEEEGNYCKPGLVSSTHIPPFLWLCEVLLVAVTLWVGMMAMSVADLLRPQQVAALCGSQTLISQVYVTIFSVCPSIGKCERGSYLEKRLGRSRLRKQRERRYRRGARELGRTGHSGSESHWRGGLMQGWGRSGWQEVRPPCRLRGQSLLAQLVTLVMNPDWSRTMTGVLLGSSWACDSCETGGFW